MALTVATLNARLTADTRDFQRGMNQAQGMAQRFGTIGKAAIGTGIAIGAAQATRAVVDFVGKGIRGAGDLAESMSKTGVVFGQASTQVTQFADKMFKDFGLPKQAILDAASSIGLIGKAAGQAEPAAAQMGVQMAKLAADASSFFNVPLEEALMAIRSGLVGETEPMRRFGVLLSEAEVKAEGLRLGLIKSGQELTQQQKVVARSSLIMNGMADATGDLERTQDSFANQVRELKGKFEGLAISVGEKLLPVMNQLVGAAAQIIDRLSGTGDATEKPKRGLEGLTDKVADFVDVGPEVLGFLKDMGADALEMLQFMNQAAGGVQQVDNSVRRMAMAKGQTIQASERTRVATEAETKANKELSDAQDDVMQSSRAVRNAGEARNDAFREYNELLARGAVDIKAVADAEGDLASRVRDVEDATKDVHKAEAALAKAREPATVAELEEATDGVKKAEIGLGAAQDNVILTQQRLTELQSSGKATALELRDAERDVASAALRVRDAQRDLAGAQTAVNTLQQQGAAGTPAVVAAQDALKTAEQKLTEQLNAQKAAAEQLAAARAGDPGFAKDLEGKKRALRDAEENLNDALKTQKERTDALREAQLALGAIQGPLRDEIHKTNAALSPVLGPGGTGGPRMNIQGPSSGGGGLLPAINITVNGAVDGNATARQIQDLLLDLQRRSGNLGFN